MNSIQSYLSNFNPFASNSPEYSAKSALQKAILSGDLHGIEAAGPDTLNKPLPNGELPLNYAAREAQYESVKKLLKLGADPLLNDDQGLNAITTAYLKEDYFLISELLKMRISNDVSFGKNQNDVDFMIASELLLHIEEAQKEIKAFASGTSKLAEMDPVLTRQISNITSGNFSKDLANSANFGLTYLHTAIILEDIKTIDQILQNPASKSLVNKTTHSGLTPLHYAASLGRLDIMKKLIEHGAILQAKQEDGISSLGLLSVKLSKQSSPLNVSKLDAALFLASSALWLTQLLPAGAVNARLLQALSTTKYATMIAGMNNKFMSALGMATYAAILSAMTNPGLSWLLDSYQPVFLGINALLTANLAYQTFQGLSSCWRNASLGYTKAMFKAVVSYSPKIASCASSIRDLGEKFDLVSKAEELPVEKLSGRDMTCIKLRGLHNRTASCIDLSKKIYECEVDGDLGCDQFTNAYNDQVARMEFWNKYEERPRVDDVYWHDSYEKHSEWKKECFQKEDGFNLETCVEKENAFRHGLESGFLTNKEYEASKGIEFKFHMLNQKEECQAAFWDITGEWMTESKMLNLTTEKVLEIKKAYHAKLAVLHPDKIPTTATVVEREQFKEDYLKLEKSMEILKQKCPHF